MSPNLLVMVGVMTKTTMMAAISMEVTVVDQMLIHNIVLNASAMIWTVQLPLNWLAMDIAMMNPTMQIVTLTVGIAVVYVQLQIIVLIVCVMKDHQQMQTVSKYWIFTYLNRI